MAEYPFDKRVWMFWQQGIEAAPEIVQRCVASWQALNPTWDVNVLDSTSLERFPEFTDRFDLSRRDIDVQKTAALLRLHLLRTYGGVWVDATVFCAVPLDTWLADHVPTGLFLYKSPGPDRAASNWFIAAAPDNPVLARLDERFSGLFADNRFWLQNTGIGEWIIEKLTPRYSMTEAESGFWLGPIATKILRVYPYFLFHFTLNVVVRESPELVEAWGTVPHVPARLPHALQDLRKGDQRERAVEHVINRESWMYKLDWRLDPTEPYWSAVLPSLTLDPTR